MSEGEMEEEVLGVDDVGILNSPKLLLGDSAVTEVAVYLSYHEEATPEEIKEHCTHPDGIDEAFGKLHMVQFLDYDRDNGMFYLKDSPVGESLSGVCRETWRKTKQLKGEIGKGEGGQIDSILFRESEEGRVIRIGGENIAEIKRDD